jgi:hypothetical protein
MQPPAQELQARDIHDGVWTFRHIFRGVDDLALSENHSLIFCMVCKFHCYC